MTLCAVNCMHSETRDTSDVEAGERSKGTLRDAYCKPRASN